MAGSADYSLVKCSQRQLVCAEVVRFVKLYLADNSTPNNSRRYKTFAAHTIISCKYYSFLLYSR
jgi:hypothetical protein